MDSVRRDLAKTLYNRKRVNPRQFRRCSDVVSSYDALADPIRLGRQIRDEKRRRNNDKLLRKAQDHSDQASDRVKDFLNQIDIEQKVKISETFECLTSSIGLSLKISPGSSPC